MLCLTKKALRTVLIVVCMLAGATTLAASETDALTISANIQQFHMPYGSILDPVFASSDPASPDYSRIVGYTHAGDSAVWTGHYLAAEAFRYQVTRSPEAFANVWRALWGIRALIDITKTDVLRVVLFLQTHLMLQRYNSRKVDTGFTTTISEIVRTSGLGTRLETNIPASCSA